MLLGHHFQYLLTYLLQKYRWLILSNQSNLKYHPDPRMDHHFHRLMNTYDYEYELFKIDPKLQDFRELKELYVQFNSRNSGKPMEARKELDALIEGTVFFTEQGTIRSLTALPTLHRFSTMKTTNIKGEAL